MQRITDITILQARATKLEGRTTAVETKNNAQGTARGALDTRAATLEASMADLWRIYNESEIPAVPPVTTPAYYVKKGGNDSLDGLTDATAWATLAKGVSILAPGDTLYVRGGTYLQTARLSISRSGTAAAPITVSSYPGETAIISGDVNGSGATEATDTPGGSYQPLVSIGGSYVTLQNVEVCFAADYGIQMTGSHVTVSGCSIHHIWKAGILVSASYGTVDGCSVWLTSERSRLGLGDTSGAISFGAVGDATPPGSAPYATIRNNLVYHNAGEGILGMHTDYGLIEGNVCYDNWAVHIYPDRCPHTTTRGNLIYWTGDTYWAKRSSGVPGYTIANEDIQGAYPAGHDVKILNNIMVGCEGGVSFWSTGTASSLVNYLIAGNTIVNSRLNGINIPTGTTAHSGTRIVGNLVYQPGGSSPGSVGTATGLTFDHNLWSRSPAAGCSGTGDVVANPLLVAPNTSVVAGQVLAAWYKLTSSSPARGAGVAHADLTEDYFETARSDPPDMGAHEY